MENSKGDKNVGNVEIEQKPRFIMSFFNRSNTFQSSPVSEFTKKPLERNVSVKNIYKKIWSVFEKPQPLQSSNLSNNPRICLPGTEDRIVIYFTSLRGVRRTFIDCNYVRMVLKAFRVELDERDISMHSAYKEELLNVLGEKSVTLPHVFIKGKYIGGEDSIRQLHETGELAKMLKEMPKMDVKVCDECGDFRFVPCINCNGSKKVFDEDEEKVRRCPDCNENGIIQCSICNVS